MPNLNKIRGRGNLPASAAHGRRGGNPSTNVLSGPQYPHHGGYNNYGLSRQHASDPKLQGVGFKSRMAVPQSSRFYGGRQGIPPTRGSIAAGEAGVRKTSLIWFQNEVTNRRFLFQIPGRKSRDISTERADSSNFARPRGPPSLQPKHSSGGMSRIARPVASGIPRPGASRLPAPTRCGIPKPNSQPGSRASSVGPHRQPAQSDQYY